MLYNKDWEKKSNPVADLLNKAADIIETRGSVKGILFLGDRGFCAQGALMSASGVTEQEFHIGWAWTRVANNKVYHEAVLVLGQKVSKKTNLFSGSHEVAHWNNDLNTSASEIIVTMRELAKELVEASARRPVTSSQALQDMTTGLAPHGTIAVAAARK